jgi:hypothetical protein
MRRDDKHIRLEFARRLQQKLDERGWSQSDLARRMAPLLPDSRIGRDNISKYCNAKVLPLSHHLEAPISDHARSPDRAAISVGRRKDPRVKPAGDGVSGSRDGQPAIHQHGGP